MNSPESSPPQVYRSTALRTVQVVLPTALFILTGSFVHWMQMQYEGMPMLTSALIIVAIAGIGISIRILNNSAILTLSDTHLSVGNGFRLFGAKPKSIPLRHIHTLHISQIYINTENLNTGQFTVIYRWPQRKMIYATATFSIAAIPDGKKLIFDLVSRTGATIKLNTGKMADRIITPEELREQL